MSLSEKAKTRFELWKEYGCCIPESEAKVKWVRLETAQQLEVVIKGLDDAKGALIAYNNELEAKIAEAQTLLGDAITELSKRHFTGCTLKIREAQRCLAGEQPNELP